MGETMKVVKTKKACEMLGCSRATFNTKHEKKLKKYKDKNGYNTYFSLQEVEKLVEKLKNLNNNILDDDFEVVE